jgi:hypothetical protein
MAAKKRCFIIMPFGETGTPAWDHNLKIYRLMIKPIVEACGYESIRADDLKHPGSITRDIIEHLHNSDLVVADLTGRNANVYYELGVRHALFYCGTIPIIRQGEKLPFDIAQYRAIEYSSELDGPDLFKQELAERIKAFESMREKKSDNPVHDILREKILRADLKNFVTRKKYEATTAELRELKKKHETLKQQNAALISQEKEVGLKVIAIAKEKTEAQKKTTELQNQVSRLQAELQQARDVLKAFKAGEKKASTPGAITLRSQPKILSVDDAKAMLKKLDFYASDWNKEGRGYFHQYEIQDIKGDKIVSERTSGLKWQQGGSQSFMNYETAKEWIQGLNRKGFAGYHDWRLPTLEEAMSLMETEKKNGDLYIDPVFAHEQRWIWTSDLAKGESWAWVVNFDGGNCYYHRINFAYSFRAVRSG